MDGAVLAQHVAHPYSRQREQHLRMRKQFDKRVIESSNLSSTKHRALAASTCQLPAAIATSPGYKSALRFDTGAAGLSVHHIEPYHLQSSAVSAPINFSAPRSPGLQSERRVDSVHSASPPKSYQSPPKHPRYEREHDSRRMDALTPSASTQSLPAHQDALKSSSSRPFQLRHGRRYIRQESYPLPCDLQELHRQNLKTMLTCTVLGRPVCSPRVIERPPQRVLEIGCGTAYWTTQCHQMFSAIGHDNILYTGLDVVSLAPDLKKQGLNWTFVKHDIRSRPWPFEDESFDLVMCKDMSLAVPTGAPSQWTMDECIRLLAPGGTLEIWESDHLTRALQPHVPAPRADDFEQEVAEKTATFPMSPSTPFAPVSNRYLRAASAWIDRALGERSLPPTPCARIAPSLLQEPDSLQDVGLRRIAIPLGQMEWDRPRERSDRKARSRSRAPNKLSLEQSSIRETALLVVVQMIESLEPLLKETSGKNTEEWSYWWAGMMMSLTQSIGSRKPFNGECLEIGAWWAVKS